MHADGPDAQRGWEIGVRRTRCVTGPQLNDCVPGAEPLHDMPLQRGAAAAGPHEPVALMFRIREGMEERVAGEAPVEDDHGVVGHLRPHRGRQLAFAGTVGAEGGPGQEVVAHGEERDEPQLRIAGSFAVAAGWAAEGRDIVRRVWRTQRGPVERVDREPPPTRLVGRRRRPREWPPPTPSPPPPVGETNYNRSKKRSRTRSLTLKRPALRLDRA